MSDSGSEVPGKDLDKAKKHAIAYTIFGILLAIALGLLIGYLLKPTKGSVRRVLTTPSGHETTPDTGTTSVPGTTICKTANCRAAAEYIKGNMNRSADPCNDFFDYVCGGWVEKNKNVEENRFSVFSIVEAKNIKYLKDLLKSNATSKSRAVTDAKTFYRACFEPIKPNSTVEEKIELQKIIEKIGGAPMYLRAPSENIPWFRKLARVNRMVIRITTEEDIPVYAWAVLFTIRIDAMGNLLLQRLRMSEKILNENRSEHPIFDSVCNYEVPACTQEEGKFVLPQTDEVAEFIVKLQKCAKIGKNESTEQDQGSNMKLAEFKKRYPDLHMLTFLEGLFKDTTVKIDNSTLVTVYHRKFFQQLQKLVKSTKPRVIENFIVYNVIRHFPIFRKPNTTGNHSELEGWCFRKTNFLFPFALSRLFVEKAEDDEIRKVLKDAVEDMRDVFVDLLKEKTWLEEDVKKKAIKKVESLGVIIGYPDWIHNNDFLDGLYKRKRYRKNETFSENQIRFYAANTEDFLNSIGQGVRNNLSWYGSPPHMLKALNEKHLNMVFFSVALRYYSEFYWPKTTKALGYSGATPMIGHQMGHTLDYSAVHYNGTGDFQAWFVGKSLEEFDLNAECFKNEYSVILDPVANMTLNGNLTVDEDIADSVGIRLAYKAYVRSGTIDERLIGLESINDRELLFIGSAMRFCSRYTAKGMRWAIKNDHHSPDNYREFIPLSNFDEFSNVFNCTEDSYMNRTEKCVLW